MSKVLDFSTHSLYANILLDMEKNDLQKVPTIIRWLGTGSINIFGLPFSGKETLGKRLAELLGAVFISGGAIVRANMMALSKSAQRETNNGELVPSKEFEELVLPYLSNKAYHSHPLILDSIGRWAGEEAEVVKAAEKGGHPIKIALILNVSTEEAERRWQEAINAGETTRIDDRNERTFNERVDEFNHKTMPVIDTYHRYKVLIPINGHQPVEDVVAEAVNKLHEFVVNHTLFQGEEDLEAPEILDPTQPIFTVSEPTSEVEPATPEESPAPVDQQPSDPSPTEPSTPEGQAGYVSINHS